MKSQNILPQPITIFVFVKKFEGVKGTTKRKCVVCGHQSIFFCMGCGRDVLGTEVYICNPKRDKGRDCWKKVHDMRKSQGANRSKLSKKRTVTFY